MLDKVRVPGEVARYANMKICTRRGNVPMLSLVIQRHVCVGLGTSGDASTEAVLSAPTLVLCSSSQLYLAS